MLVRRMSLRHYRQSYLMKVSVVVEVGVVMDRTDEQYLDAKSFPLPLIQLAPLLADPEGQVICCALM